MYSINNSSNNQLFLKIVNHDDHLFLFDYKQFKKKLQREKKSLDEM